MEAEDLKIVLNVRDNNYIALLEQIKDNTGINYQNVIKFGLLLMFQKEVKKIKNFEAEQARVENQEKEKVEAKEKEEEIKDPVSHGIK